MKSLSLSISPLTTPPRLSPSHTPARSVLPLLLVIPAGAAATTVFEHNAARGFLGPDSLAPFVAAKVARGSGAGKPAVDNFTMLTNGVVSLGIDTSRGGSVGFFGPATGDYAGQNFVNIHDFGREVSASPG